MASSVDAVAAATRSSVQSDNEDRAVDATEPASLSGVLAWASSMSEAVLSSTTPARPTYSGSGVRLRRVRSDRMSPQRSRSQTVSAAIRLAAARYQWAEWPRLPLAVK